MPALSEKDFSTEWSVIVTVPAGVSSYRTTVDVPREICHSTRGEWSHYQFKSFYSYRQNNFYNPIPEWNLVSINTSAPGEQIPVSTSGFSSLQYTTAVMPNLLSGTRFFGPSPPKYIKGQPFPPQMQFEFSTLAGTLPANPGVFVLTLEFFL